MSSLFLPEAYRPDSDAGEEVTLRQASIRALFHLSLGCLAWLVAGCASTHPTALGWKSVLQQELRRSGLDPAEVIVPFSLTPAARAWLAEHTPDPEASPRRRLELLLDALLGPQGLDLTYERSFTGTADEVLARRSGNCLGFVNLFVALARELGLPAYFLAVEDKPLYNREGDLVLVSDHVAAGYGKGSDLLLLDFAVDGEQEYKKIREVSDLEAVAKYYSNRGAEMLKEGRPRAGISWLETSTRLMPGMASAWVNLGVARRRTGDSAGAEAAYSRALEADPEAMTAYTNLAALLRVQGRQEEAEGLMAVTQRTSNRNPYSFLSLGDWSLESGRVEEARRFYRRALLLDSRSAEAYAALGELELQRGREARARRWLKKAQKLEAQDERTRRLAQRLEGDKAG